MLVAMLAEPTSEQRAAWALRRGDPLAVLSLTQGIESHLGLAVRGAALAQLEENADAMAHLERALTAASRAGDSDTAARAALALAEIQIAERDLSGAARRLAACEAGLRAQPENLVLFAVLRSRVALLRGDAKLARELLSLAALPDDPFAEAVLALSRAELFLATGEVDAASDALAAARVAAERSRHGFLLAEIDAGAARLLEPIARLRRAGGDVPLNSFELARARAPGAVALLDTLRATFSFGDRAVELSRRPILFSILRRLIEADGASVPVAELVGSFGARAANEAHRANLRVEIGRLRKLLPASFSVDFVAAGYKLGTSVPIALLLPMSEGLHPEMSALLSDGQAWRAEEIASVLALSTRTVQRRLASMKDAGLVRVGGSSRNARWSTVSREIATLLGQISALWWERPR